MACSSTAITKGVLMGFLIITCLSNASSTRVKRFVGNGQRGGKDWNWSRSGQLTDGQNKGSQSSWPTTKGDSGMAKGRPDSKTNRDGNWSPDNWSSNETPEMGWNTEPQGNNKGSAYPDEGENTGGNLETLLRGVPGMDFPNFMTVPDTGFDCSQMPSQGYYGDVEAGCQVFHICQPGNRKDSFLCPLGTIFNQKYFVCDWWFNVNCSDTTSYYDLNSEVYKEPAAEAPAVTTTTEKTLPWNAQDLNKKRPTKSWGPPTPPAAQSPRKKDTPNRRGSKTNVGGPRSETSNSWSQSDVQKEVTLSWNTASGSSSGSYGSSSISSSALIPTSKPIWYGIDGQPAKDQSNGMKKRRGLMHTAAPFGTRMRSTSMATAGTWAPSEVYEPTVAPTKGITFRPSSTTHGWLKTEDIPETSIVPTGVKGVWEQQSTRRSDQGVNLIGRRGVVLKSESTGFNNKHQQIINQQNSWGQRQNFRATASTVTEATVPGRGWVSHESNDDIGGRGETGWVTEQSEDNLSGRGETGWVTEQSEDNHRGSSEIGQNHFANSNINVIPRHKIWQ